MKMATGIIFCGDDGKLIFQNRQAFRNILLVNPINFIKWITWQEETIKLRSDKEFSNPQIAFPFIWERMQQVHSFVKSDICGVITILVYEVSVLIPVGF
jgi:hypothetical protein